MDKQSVRQVLEDSNVNRYPTVNLKAAINDLEQGRIHPKLLKISVKLLNDPTDYAVNNSNKKKIEEEED